MTTTLVLVLVLAAALAGVGFALNHVYARVALVELALNEGLPPGHAPVAQAQSPTIDAAQLLPAGVHIFLSRSCHACQRLIDELDQTRLDSAASLHFRYLDRPRPIASSAADRNQATLVTNDVSVAQSVGADPLPYTVAVGDLGLTAGAVTPTVAQIIQAARDAGIKIGVSS